MKKDDVHDVLEMNLNGLLEFCTSDQQYESTVKYHNQRNKKVSKNWTMYCSRRSDTFCRSFHPRGRVWVAVDNLTQKVVGSMETKARDPRSRDMDGIQLDNVCVVPEYRGKGVAQALLERVEAHCKKYGFKTIYLTNQDNLTRAISFYEKHGFEFVRKRPWESYVLVYYSKSIK